MAEVGDLMSLQAPVAVSRQGKDPVKSFFADFDGFPHKLKVPDGVSVSDDFRIIMNRFDGLTFLKRITPLKVEVYGKNGQLALDFFFRYEDGEGNARKSFYICYTMTTESFDVHTVNISKTEPLYYTKGAVIPLEKRKTTYHPQFEGPVHFLEPRWFWAHFRVVTGKDEPRVPNVRFYDLKRSLSFAMKVALDVRFCLAPNKFDMQTDESSEEDEESSDDSAE